MNAAFRCHMEFPDLGITFYTPSVHLHFFSSVSFCLETGVFESTFCDFYTL